MSALLFSLTVLGSGVERRVDTTAKLLLGWSKRGEHSLKREVVRNHKHVHITSGVELVLGDRPIDQRKRRPSSPRALGGWCSRDEGSGGVMDFAICKITIAEEA